MRGRVEVGLVHRCHPHSNGSGYYTCEIYGQEGPRIEPWRTPKQRADGWDVNQWPER